MFLRSQLVCTPFAPGAGPGAACLAASSLPAGRGWCLGLRGGEAAGAHAEGLLDVSFGSWWRWHSSLIN